MLSQVLRPLLSLAIVLVTLRAFAADEAGPLAGHSYHGEAFNEGPRQKARPMTGTGRVRFPITTKSPAAQDFFNQGVSQLHGFWYFEAERSFRQAAALDPDCPMAYWGMAMANIKNAKRAKGFIAEAVKRKAHASSRETMWIDALAACHREDKRSATERKREHLRSQERVSKEYPDDLEAKAFLVFYTWEYSGKEIPLKHDEVDALIAQVLAVAPMHPVHHYRIHLWDDKKAANALSSAALCGQSSPDIAHMWHMPGHIYSKLHRYADAAWQQEASARVDHAQMMRDRVLPDQIHNYAHNNEWLVRDLSHVGRVHDAIGLAKNMIELPRHPAYNTLTKRGSANFGRLRLFELLQRYELWEELLALSETTYLEPTDILAEQVDQLRAVGVAQFSLGRPVEGGKPIAQLETLLQEERARQSSESKSASASTNASPSKIVPPAPSGKGSQSGKEPTGSRPSSSQTNATVAQKLETAITELKAYQALSANDPETPRSLFAKVKDLPKDRLARLEFQMGDKDRALQLARKAMNAATNQVQPLANYIDLAYRCGKYEEAFVQFVRLRELSAPIDLDAPVFQRLKPVAKDLKWPADWRAKPVTTADVGERPNLNKLGPFRWQPSPAPDWTLPDLDGRRLSLKAYRGKPVIVIFYLGYGCPHCIEQLNAFAPLTKEFHAAGISLVAVSTDSVAGLKRTFEKSQNGDGFPFPLVSDKELKVFKAYRAFDDFEKIPLHGTFLIDGNGLVRWQDINYQPFKETKFLLDEARRLLGKVKQPLLAGAQVAAGR